MDNVTVEIINNTNFDKLLMSDKDMQKKVHKIVKQVLQKATRKMRTTARGVLPNDPRHAYKAVRMTVYKRMIGGNINILSRRKATNTRVLMSGGTRGQSRRTQQLESYYGADRGFILRFNNAGTNGRVVKGINGRSGFVGSLDDRSKKRTYKGDALGYRGQLTARNWFAGASQKELEAVAKEFTDIIDELIKQEFE